MTPQKRIKRQSSKPIFGWLQKKLGGVGNANTGTNANGAANRTFKGPRGGERPRVVTMPQQNISAASKSLEVTHVNLNDNDSRIGRSTPARSSRSSTWSPPLEAAADDDASIRPLPPTSPPSPAPSRSSSYLSDPRTFKSISASTKPTTLLSIDLGSNGMAHIAQAPPTPSTASHMPIPPPRFSTSSISVSNSNSITFSALPPNLRSENGGTPGGLQAPLHTTHHPRHNPRPSSPPQDNASVLTLASSAFAFPSVRVANWFGDSQSQFGLETSSQHGELEDVHVEDASVRALRPRSSRRGSWESEASGWSTRVTRDRNKASLNGDLDASATMTAEDEESNGELSLQPETSHLTFPGRIEAIREEGTRTPPAKELTDLSDASNDKEVISSGHSSQLTPTKNPLIRTETVSSRPDTISESR